MKRPRHSLAALPLVAASVTITSVSSAAPLYWKTSTAAAWTSATWATSPGGSYDQAWVAGSDVVFEDNSGTTLTIGGPGAATDFASITANENVTLTPNATALGTSGSMATVDVAADKTLAFGSQTLATAAGTGFIKNGPGTWSLNGSAYPGGFTLNDGTVAAGGNNALGSGGALVINGGTISSNGTGARDFSGKFSSITLGGDVTLGSVTNTGALTFNNATSLGAATRTLTVNSGVTHTGAISGTGVGLIKAGPGVLTLGGTNTYTGPTTISAGVLTINTTNSLPGFGTGGSYSVASGAGLAVANAITDANIATMLGTGNFAAGSAIGFDTSSGARTYGVVLANTGLGSLGLVKAGGNNLTLSAANSFSGGTTIIAGSVIAGHNGALGTGSAGNSLAASANLTLNAGIVLSQTGTIAASASGNGSGTRSTITLGNNSTLSGDIRLNYSGLTGSGNAFVQIFGNGSSGNASVFNGNVSFTGGSASATGANNIFVLRGNNGGAGFAKATGNIDLLADNASNTGTLRIVDTNASWELSGTANKWTTLDFNSNGSAAQKVFVNATNTLDPTGVVTCTGTGSGALNLTNFAASSGFDQTVAGINDGPGKVVVTSSQAATLTIGGAGTYTSSGVISGSVSLVKSGTGKQTLSGANTYTGSTTITGGTLSFGATGVMPEYGDVSISSGTLDLRKGTSVRTQLVDDLTLSDATLEFGLNATPDQLDAYGVTASGTNTVKLHGSTPVGSYELIRSSGPLSGTFVLDTSGVTPSGFPVSYSASIQGSSYVLNVTGAATPFTAYWKGDVSSIWNDGSLAPDSNWATDETGATDAGQVPGAITDVHFSAASAANTGTTLGQDTSINTLSFDTGSTTVGGAHTLTILNESGSGFDVYPGASATIATAGLVNSSGTTIHETGTLTVDSGGLGSGPLAVDGTLNLNMSLTKESLGGAATGVISRSIAGAGTLTVSGTTSGNYQGSIGDGAGTLALSKGGSSTLTLAGDNAYSGGTTIAGGIVRADTSTAVGSGAVSVNGGVRLSLGDNVTLANAISIGANTSPQGGGILEASSAVTGAATLEGPITITANAAGGGHFTNVSSGGAFHVKGAVTSSVPVTHRSGTVTYWGGGSYTAMSVTGTVRLGADHGLATGATVTLGVSGNATLDLAGYNQTLAGIAKTANTNTVTIGNSSTTADSLLTITGTSTYDGVITNAIGGGTHKTALSVTGGTLTLTGVNAYTGNTTLSASAGLVLADNAQLRIVTGVTTNGITGAGSASIHGDFNIDTSFTDAAPMTSGSWNLGNASTAFGGTFRVISGTTEWTATGDMWTKSVGTKNYSFDESTGILSMSSAGGGFDAWAASKGLAGADADFGADPDLDGIDNGLEFVLGGEPNPANPGSNSTALLPKVSQSGGDMIFTFNRKDASESGVTLVFQWSTDLTFPSPANDVPIGAVDSTTDSIVVDLTEDSPDADTDTVVVTIPSAKAAGGRIFGRLSAVKVP